MNNKLVEDYESKLPVYAPGSKDKATRVVSGEVLNVLADLFPEVCVGQLSDRE